MPVHRTVRLAKARRERAQKRLEAKKRLAEAKKKRLRENGGNASSSSSSSSHSPSIVDSKLDSGLDYYYNSPKNRGGEGEQGGRGRAERRGSLGF